MGREEGGDAVDVGVDVEAADEESLQQVPLQKAEKDGAGGLRVVGDDGEPVGLYWTPRRRNGIVWPPC